MKLAPNLFSSSSWNMVDGRDIGAWKDSWLELRFCIKDYGLHILKFLDGMSLCYLVDSNGDEK